MLYKKTIIDVLDSLRSYVNEFDANCDRAYDAADTSNLLRLRSLFLIIQCDAIVVDYLCQETLSLLDQYN